MRIRHGVIASVAALAAAALSVPVAQASSGVPRPLAGHWKIEKVFSDVTSGSLVINKARNRVSHVKFAPIIPNCANTAELRVAGSFHLFNVADDKHGATDNSPDWSIARTNGGSRKVTVHQGKKTFHGRLTLGFGSKNGTHKPVKFVTGEFLSNGCTVVLGGAHG
jgi:hypothetical protein